MGRTTQMQLNAGISDMAKCSAKLTSILSVHHLLQFLERHEKACTRYLKHEQAECRTNKGGEIKCGHVLVDSRGEGSV